MSVENEFLGFLIGNWTLEGEMFLASGTVPLHQRVSAEWSLRGAFVEVRCTELQGAPYEALYLIGHDPSVGSLVFHLFDSMGVSARYRFGVGKLVRNEVTFAFPYESGLFMNTLRHEPNGSFTWTLTDCSRAVDQLFAVKRMRRA